MHDTVSSFQTHILCTSYTLSLMLCHISNYVQEMQSIFSLRSLWMFMNTLELQPGRDLEGYLPLNYNPNEDINRSSKGNVDIICLN